MKQKISQLIKTLSLQPHPEGGYYKETYRSLEEIPEACLDKKYIGNRKCSTCIYFMLTSDTFSAFHRINQDEIWHFYQGSTLNLYMISPTGELTKVLIGSDILNGEIPQFVVPAGFWFAAKVADENSYSLVGCTVSPGFDFKDFELADMDSLSNIFPEHRAIIKEFTR
jgi:uncharacterized protein